LEHTETRSSSSSLRRQSLRLEQGGFENGQRSESNETASVSPSSVAIVEDEETQELKLVRLIMGNKVLLLVRKGMLLFFRFGDLSRQKEGNTPECHSLD
jgi:hypothetical protein